MIEFSTTLKFVIEDGFENSIILKYMLDNRIQQLKTIGVYTPKLKPNNVLIVIQK